MASSPRRLISISGTFFGLFNYLFFHEEGGLGYYLFVISYSLLSFHRYLSGIVAINAQKGSSQTSSSNKFTGFRSRVDLSMAGDLIASSIDPSQVSNRGGDTLDTFLWIPQLGACL
jgi:hypothetical protein